MTLTLKSFTGGQLPGSKGTLYTVPAGSTVSLRVSLVNTSTSDVKVNLYASGGYRFIPKDMVLSAGDAHYTDSYEMEDGDNLEGDATMSGVVDYLVRGLVRT